MSSWCNSICGRGKNVHTFQEIVCYQNPQTTLRNQNQSKYRRWQV